MYRTYRAVESVRYIYMKETETTLAKTISVAGVNAAYDNACKRILSNKNILAFARYLDQRKKPVWIRHVVVPGITFEEAELTELGHFLKTLSNMEKLEVLPYHALGKVKYDNLGMDYVLKDTPQLTKEEAKKAEQMIRDAMS